MADAVDRALAAVDHDDYTDEGGAVLPQSSSPAIIAGMLRLLDVRPGMHVFEAGTGSGFSTALLCHLVGPRGRVVSMDVDPRLTARAAGLLQRAGLAQAEAVAGDARGAPPAGARFDRLVAWATADLLPGAWVAALPQGQLVAPLRLLPLEGAAPVAAMAVRDGAPVVEGFSPGAFVPLTAAPVTDFAALRRAGADVVWGDASEGVLLSAPWLRDSSPDQRRRWETTGSQLAPCPTPLGSGDSSEALWWYLVAKNPQGLTSGVAVRGGRVFGCGDHDGMVLLRRGFGADGAECLTAGNGGRPLRDLSRWIDAWRAAGRPGLSLLKGRVAAAPGGAWRVHASV